MWKNYLSIVLLLTSCMYIRPKQNSMSDLSQNEWAQALTEQQQAVVLDVRTQEEFESGYIPKAINIDIQMGPSFIDKINTLEKNKSYYVYCRSGARSAQAVQLMRDLGFNETYNLLGGILDWEGEVVK
jgi:rhodanese-related sulfurtransferase